MALSSDSANMIEVRNLAAKWHIDDTKPIISDINLTIPKKSRHIFVGTVGSGKVRASHSKHHTSQ